jgi:hypothetical protein
MVPGYRKDLLFKEPNIIIDNEDFPNKKRNAFIAFTVAGKPLII